MNAVVTHEVSDIERMARAFAASKLFGVQTVEQALALCLIAQAEGRHPATAAQDYHILQGRPAKKADAMLRDFLGGGGKVEWHELNDAKADATFSHPQGGSARIDWTMERAKKAQLTTAMWSKYPRQMLRARVVSEGVRTVFPMATSGMYVPEEVVEFTPSPTPQSAPPEVIANMRNVTPAPETEAPVVTRHNANQCKTRVTVRPDTGEEVTKAALAAKLAHEMTDIMEVTELLAWRHVWEPEVSTWPQNWEVKMWSDWDIHMGDLRRLTADAHIDPLDAEMDQGEESFERMIVDAFPGAERVAA